MPDVNGVAVGWLAAASASKAQKGQTAQAAPVVGQAAPGLSGANLTAPVASAAAGGGVTAAAGGGGGGY